MLHSFRDFITRNVFVIVVTRHFFQCRANNSDAQMKLRVHVHVASFLPAPLLTRVQKRATIYEKNTVQFTSNR
jgi:hypothetical protein